VRLPRLRQELASCSDVLGTPAGIAAPVAQEVGEAFERAYERLELLEALRPVDRPGAEPDVVADVLAGRPPQPRRPAPERLEVGLVAEEDRRNPGDPGAGEDHAHLGKLLEHTLADQAHEVRL